MGREGSGALACTGGPGRGIRHALYTAAAPPVALSLYDTSDLVRLAHAADDYQHGLIPLLHCVDSSLQASFVTVRIHENQPIYIQFHDLIGYHSSRENLDIITTDMLHHMTSEPFNTPW